MVAVKRIPSYFAFLLLTANCGARSSIDAGTGTFNSASGGVETQTGGTSTDNTVTSHTGGNSTTGSPFTSTGGSSGTVSTSPSTGSAALQPLAVAVSAGSNHTCASLDDFTVRCWGSNEHGRLGNGTYADSVVPAAVAGITTAIGINSGGQHSCVLLDDHSVRCWGSNDFGQLGDGTLVESPLPLPVKGLSNVTSLSTGYQHTCAIVNGDSAWCWGANESGQVGTAPSTSVLTPTEVQGTGALLAIAAGRFHTCAIQNTETQSIICWGSNAQSQLGTTTPNQISPTPVNVDNVTHAAAIAAGSQHNCAVIQVANDATEVRCWGWNYYGQLGDGSTTTTMGSAIDVTNATLVSAADHTCALEADGQLQCWGFNRSGELGNGSTQDSSTPTTFTGQVHDANAVSAAAVHTCARFGSGKLMCWGDNSQGQLGDGSTVGSLLPVSVVGL